jgi:hypothetical protein
VTIELQDSTATFVPIFGGTVVDFGIGIAASGVVGINQSVRPLRCWSFGQIAKSFNRWCFTQDFDGDQILTILTDLLVNSWNEVPAALTWATYDPTTQWQDAQNTGLGEIDTPGSYELAQRSSSTIDVYSLVSALSNIGIGLFLRKRKAKFPMPRQIIAQFICHKWLHRCFSSSSFGQFTICADSSW